MFSTLFYYKRSQLARLSFHQETERNIVKTSKEEYLMALNKIDRNDDDISTRLREIYIHTYI
ncbi:hypothetical protein V1478_017775, partial [Vespula squamosa]